MQEIEVTPEDGVSLSDLWQNVRDGWRWVVGGAALGAMGAGLALAVLPPQYEAVAVVQVGQVASAPVEPALQAIERIRSGSFQVEAAKSAGYLPWAEVAGHSSKAGERYFSLQLMKNTQLIEIRTKADTRDNAGRIASAIVETLAKRHGELAAPALDRLGADLLLAQDRLQSAEKELAALGAMVSPFSVRDERFAPVALIASSRQFKQSELFALRQAISALKVARIEPATQRAKAIEAIFVAGNPISPKKGLIATFGTMGGLMLGLLAAVVTKGRWRAKKKDL